VIQAKELDQDDTMIEDEEYKKFFEVAKELNKDVEEEKKVVVQSPE
jgi:hypothetical protein